MAQLIIDEMREYKEIFNLMSVWNDSISERSWSISFIASSRSVFIRLQNSAAA